MLKIYVTPSSNGKQYTQYICIYKLKACFKVKQRRIARYQVKLRVLVQLFYRPIPE